MTLVSCPLRGAVQAAVVVLTIAQVALAKDLDDLLAAIDRNPLADHSRAIQKVVESVPDLDVEAVTRWISGDPPRRSMWGCEILRGQLDKVGVAAFPQSALRSLLMLPDIGAQELGTDLLAARLRRGENMKEDQSLVRALAALTMSQSAAIHDRASAALNVMTGATVEDSPDGWMRWYRARYGEMPDLRHVYPRVEVYVELEESGAVSLVNSTVTRSESAWTAEVERHTALALAYDVPLRLTIFIGKIGRRAVTASETISKIKECVGRTKVSAELRMVAERALVRSLPDMPWIAAWPEDLERAHFTYGERAGLLRVGECLRLRGSKAPQPAVIWVASRNWQSRPFDASSVEARWVLDIVRRGVAVVWVRHGSVPYFTLTEAVEDVRDALAYVVAASEDLHIDPRRVALIGYSSGGHLALASILGVIGEAREDPKTAQLREEVRGAIAIAPPVDLRSLLVRSLLVRLGDESSRAAARVALGTRSESGVVTPCGDAALEDRAWQLSVRGVVDGGVPALLILYGEKDTVVPASDLATLGSGLQRRQAGVELRMLVDCGHELRDFDASRAVAVQWLVRLLAE